MLSTHQHTVAKPIECHGIGLHSGETVEMQILPSEPGSGIIFKRKDIDEGLSSRAVIFARYDLVTDTMLGTTIENEHGVSVSTIEHLMAALWGMGIDNAIIELNAAEVPIMDGSSAPFIALIESVGLSVQNRSRMVIKITDTITVSEGDSTATLEPDNDFKLDLTIDFPHKAISRQSASYNFSKTHFKEALSEARTFGFANDVAKLQAAGLARGGSLENAIVLDETQVLNAGGLRFDNEFVRHKALDCVGDYFLAGMRIVGKVTTYKPGHSINNKLMHALFNSPSAWRLCDMALMDKGMSTPRRMPNTVQTNTDELVH